VRKIFTPFRFALCAFCLLSLIGLRAYGQAPDKKQTNEHPNGIVQDWSRRHAVYPRIGPIQSLIAVEHDPRAILSWQEAEREDWHRDRDRHHHHDHDGDNDNGAVTGLQRDWSISLGGGTTAPGMFPAKFTFDPTATPTCIISVAPAVPIPDYVVFTVNAAGGAAQPNIVAFQDLYSGTTGGTGQCNTQRPTYFTGDTITSAATFWSYNVTAADGVVSTSPALSIDGTKVAFVEKGGGGTAHFHVLAWNGGTTTVAGDGVTTTNSQIVTAPKTITGVSFVATAPTAGSGNATDLALNVGTTQSDTISSPFVDYVHDTAYVGNDSGTLFRIANVFCAMSPCTPGTSAAPALDTTWGGTGAVATGCSGQLTGPVVAGTGNVFVGCSDGTLYGFTPSGSAIPGSPLTVGSGGATGGIVDPPVVDVVNGFLYVVAGNSSGLGTPSVLVQAGTTSFTSPTPVVATLGAGGLFKLHAPYFNEAYFSSPFNGAVANVQGTTTATVTTGSTSNWQIYEWADSGVAGSPATLYGVGFNSSGHDMTSGPASNFLQISSSTSTEFSPVTEFLNGGTDQLFVSALEANPPNIIKYNLTDFAGLFPNVFPVTAAEGSSATEGSGTSAMIVDNVSAAGQASSIYFGVPSANTAVKLTQSGLQ
jgi:hypothetical protein